MEEKKTNVSEYVYKVIEEKIFSGEWGPDTKITSEPQLAKELNVSRMSVREAIEKLVALDILTKKRGEGTFVNRLTPSVYMNSLIPMITLDRDNYLQILEFRLITEVESARLCAERCKEKTLSEIEKCYDIMVNHQDDHEPFAKADMEFHMKIAEGTQNPLIIKVNSVLQNLLIYHQKVLNSILGPMGGLTEHKQILEAIKKRDPELSALFMRRHIERTIRELKEKDL